jgi:hypothetical protein
MADEPTKSSSGFTSKFLPGLVLGLIVGGLAGAFLPAAFDSFSGPPTSGAVKANTARNPSAPRDARPTPPAPETKPPDASPAEPKPADAKPAEPKPEEKPAPAEAPK